MTVPLTREQKLAGREFRARCSKLLSALAEASPAGARCSVYTVWYRHLCLGRGSWALFLREHRRESPDGLFAFCWREGTCSRCNLTVRSGGRVVRAAVRLAEKGAVIHAGDEHEAVS